MNLECPPECPQTVGDLIGRGFRAYRRQAPLFFKHLLGPTIFSAAGILSLQWTISRGWSYWSGTTSGIACCLSLLVFGLLSTIFSKWILTLRQLALVRVADGFSQDYPQAYQIMRKRRWPVLAVYVLSILFAVLAAVMAIVIMVAVLVLAPKQGLAAGIASVVTSLGGMLVLALSLALLLLGSFVVLSVVACEEGGFSHWVSRGLDLLMSDLPRACGFGALLCLTAWMLHFAMSLPVVLLSFSNLIDQGITSERLADTYNVPVYIMVITQVWESLVNMLVWPAVYLSFGFFYYDLRLRQEGLDLLRKLEDLEPKAA